MNPLQAFKRCFFQQLLTLKGRTSRAEFWWCTLFSLIIVLPLYYPIQIVTEQQQALGAFSKLSPALMVLAGLCFAITLWLQIVLFTVTIRRLHDMNFRAWWILIFYVLCFTGILWVLWYIFMAFPGTKGPNRFGESTVPPAQA